MKKQFSKSNTLLVIIIAGIAIALSIISYQFSTNAVDEILQIASANARSNAEIQAHDLANVLVNKIDVVSSNLQILSEASSIQNHDIESAISLFTSARESTSDFVTSYFWIDKDGRLVWADAFTNKTIEQQYNGQDRSYRDYYLKPRDTLAPYYSTVIESVDRVPRLYIGYPIMGKEQSQTYSSNNINSSFKRVVVAAIDVSTLGKYVQAQLIQYYNVLLA